MAQYKERDYKIDYFYRKFYYDYDALEERVTFEGLRDLVENIYTNEYLSKLLPKWNEAIKEKGVMDSISRQTHFYNQHIQFVKDKVIVIISDALRYEVGAQLLEKFNGELGYKNELDLMLSVIPSYTRLGMAALLPHQSLELTNDYKVQIDGMGCDDLKARQQILTRYVPNSRCIQFDDVKNMKKMELKQLLIGMEVVYIYHNQIDARGDKPNTENEVFTACEEAVDEIYTLVKNLSGSATRFIVTADHGFIYKRDKLQESSKIENIAQKDAYINRRFVVAHQPCIDHGVQNLSLGEVLENQDTKVISFPYGSDIFKLSGGGQNFVHGGSSPQEVLIPLLKIKTERGNKEVKIAALSLVSSLHKITNLNTTLEFFQSEAVGNKVKETIYKLYFISQSGERISNENIYVADNKEEEPQKRVFRLCFRFKDKKYDKTSQYYLVAYDEKNDIEVLRHEVVMDIAFL